jgi:hypothetical protein
MKTSNKLILAFIVLLFGASLAVHGVLYLKYQKGDFVAQEKLRSESFVDYRLPKSRVIVCDGTIWVSLIPADHFMLALPRINSDPDAGMFQNEGVVKEKLPRRVNKAVSYTQQGDTLFITGNIDVPIHRPFSEWYYRRGLPVVEVYAPSFEHVVLDHGQICLRGGKVAGGVPIHFTVLNSTLWIGMQDAANRHDVVESFDSIAISATNSSVVINSPARIEHFGLALRDSSALYDQFSYLKNSYIVTSPESHANLTGENLKRSQITVH